MLTLCVCMHRYVCKKFCPYVIFMSHLPILQHSPCCCHQHFVFSTWLLPAFDSRDSKEDPAMNTQQQNRSVWTTLWQILQYKTQTCYFSFIWAIPRSQTEISPAGCWLPPFPLLWFLIPALNPQCLFPLPRTSPCLDASVLSLVLWCQQQDTNTASNYTDPLCSAWQKEDSMPQLQEMMALMAGSVGSSSPGDTTPAPCPCPPLSPPGWASRHPQN